MEKNSNNAVVKIDVKQNKKHQKEHKIARHRGFKNFLIFFAGFFTSLVLLFGILFVVFKFVPIKSVVKDTDGVVSEEVAESSILDLLLNYDKYSLGDFPVVVDALKSAIDSSGANDFVGIDYEKLKTLSFSGDGNLKDQIMDCVTITATLSSIVENDSELGVLNNLSVVTTAEEVVPDTSASDFNPKLYYYKDGNVYKRAYTDEKTLVEGAIDKAIYYPPLKDISLMELTAVIGDRLGMSKVKDVVKAFSQDFDANSMLMKIIGDKKISEMNTINEHTIMLKDMLGEYDENKEIYDILFDITSEKDINKLTLAHLQNIDTDDIKLVTVLGGYESNETLYDILMDAQGITDKNEIDKITVSSLSSLASEDNINKIRLVNILGKYSENEVLYKILMDIEGISDASQVYTITLGNLKGLTQDCVNKIKLTNILGEYESNKMLFDILMDAQGITDASQLSKLTIGDLSNFDKTKIKLSTFIGESTGNNILDAILREGATLGNIVDVVNNLEFSDVFVSSSECFTAEKTNIISTAKYKKNEDGSYTLKTADDGTTDYYIKQNIMLFLLYDFDEVDENGYAKSYTKKSVKFVNFEASEISTNLKKATIRQLIDVGLIEDKEGFALTNAYAKTLNFYLEGII